MNRRVKLDRGRDMEPVTKSDDAGRITPSSDDRTHLEYLILADSVENADGKPRITGASWDTLLVGDIGRAATLPFACGVKVPWAEADDQHRLTLSVTGADGRPIAPHHEETFLVGRSRLAGPEDPGHQPFTIRWQVIFPAYGGYLLTATVDARADDARRVPFFVLPPAEPEPVISEAEMNIIDEELGLLD
jgi:hypothetical protein